VEVVLDALDDDFVARIILPLLGLGDRFEDIVAFK
jgi:hypothetical protein